MSSEPEKKPEERDWTDKVADALGVLGFNRNRIRWKLHIWDNERQKRKRSRENRSTHVHYAHKTCPECSALQDRDATVCSRCEAPLSGHRWHVLRRLGMSAPGWVSMSSFLGLLMVIVYARLLLAGTGGGIVSMDVGLVFRHGGQFPPAVSAGDWWRLGTAIFLHFGLWHIGFNLFALAVVGKHVEELYGRWYMLFLFMATGVLANVASFWWDLGGVSAGASGAVMGLIGVVAGWGHADGTRRGRAIRNDMLKWCAYTVIFGFAIGADNVAHLAGFAAGAVFAFVLPPERLALPVLRPLRIGAAVVGLVACLGFVAATLVPPKSNVRTTVSAAEQAEARARVKVTMSQIDRCKRLLARDRNAVKQIFSAAAPPVAGEEAAACWWLREIPKACKQWPDMWECAEMRPILEALVE